MRVGDLMVTTGVKFGTSGARGLVSDMTDQVCYSYARGFLSYVLERGALRVGDRVALAGDYRASTGRILAACAQAVRDMGCQPLNGGRIPSPALAAYAMAQRMPSMMVTGSHIPEDRNGIKFNLPSGEILKQDEAGIADQPVVEAPGLFAADGLFSAGSPALPPEEPAALHGYVRRFLDFFEPDCLADWRIGLYEHSSVAREALHQILTGLGATVTRLGFSDVFVPVDTEAIRPEDRDLAQAWCADGGFDALVSTDGDGDRPLLSDASGHWLRGDIAGILCAQALDAEAVATPVSCNTAVERSGAFRAVRRTRIGSPYVIEGMQALLAEGYQPVVGYEANGGFLTASAIEHNGATLTPLPTRDAAILLVAVLRMAKRRGLSIAALCSDLPERFTDSDRLKNFPVAVSQARLSALMTGAAQADCEAFNQAFGDRFASAVAVDHTDGVRATLATGEIVHLRPSGNAPELRAYTEADTPERARELNTACLDVLRGWL